MSKLYLIKDHKLLSNNTEYIKELYEFTLDIIFMKLKNSDASIFHNYFSKFIRYMIDTIEDDGTIDYCIEECEKISIEGKLILHKYINILNPIFQLNNNLDKDLTLIYCSRKLVQFLYLNKDLNEIERILNIDINRYVLRDIFKLFKINNLNKLLKIINTI